jgi:hypothetical protein
VDPTPLATVHFLGGAEHGRQFRGQDVALLNDALKHLAVNGELPAVIVG